MSNHIIYSQKMMLTVESQQDWEMVQAQISEFCNNELPELFNSVFDQVATVETIRIDQLNLNLGNIPMNKLGEVMKDQILNQLYKQLKEYKLTVMNDNLTSNKKHSALFKNVGSFSKQAFHNEQKISNKVETHIDDYEALVYYCETGIKPWWISSEVNFEPSKILLNIYKYDKPLFVQLINAVKEDSVVYQRLKQLINKSIFFSEYLKINKKDDFIKHFISNIKIYLYHIILDIWLDEIEPNKNEIISQNFETWLLAFVKKNPIIKEEIAEIVNGYLAKNVSAKNQQLILDPLSNFLTSNKVNSDDQPKHQIPRLKKTIQQKMRGKKLLLDSLMIENAGLVIIHPFIKRLFETLGFLKNDSFVNELTQQKAIIYLHYLVYDKYPEDESKLLLNKILCSAAPEMVIQLNNINFSVEELAEADELKKAIISHWNVLGSTSPAGLTENFIIRNASLNFKDGNWNINVERKGIDILLDRLPWGLTMIKLPWNKYLIQVNW